MKIKLAIIGSGDLGQQIAHLAVNYCQYEFIGFYDDFKEKGTKINDSLCLGKIDDILEHFKKKLFDEIIIAVGYKHLEFKKMLYTKLADKVPFATIIHPSVIKDRTSQIGRGSVIYAGCIIDQYAKVEENVLLNLGCCVSHDTVVGAHSFLSPKVCLAGFVKIGEMNMIGINTTIIDNITTVEQVQTGGGTVVVKNINRRGLFVGNPARFVR